MGWFKSRRFPDSSGAQDTKCPVQGHGRGVKLQFLGHTIKDLGSGFWLAPDDNRDLLKMLKVVA